jgi:molecular chaperone DnaK (HSP70)
MTLAIDFGTSNTVVARWNPVNQGPETLKLPGLSTLQTTNPPLIPSLVYVEDANQGQVQVGQQVRDRGLDLANDPRYFRAFKRGIGSNVQGFLPDLDGQPINFEQVGDWFLRQVLATVEQVPLPVDSLVVTVPVDSFETYRSWLGGVFQALQVQEVRMLDEPTAAALGYGMADRERLLVIDFGGGTLDLSLVQLQNNQMANQKPLGFILKWGEKSFGEPGEQSGQRVRTARVLAKAGRNLGGADLDHWISDYLSQTLTIANSPLLTRLAERLKIQLSLQQQAQETYFDDQTFASYELKLNRQEFETILTNQGFFQQLDGAMTQLLQQARQQGLNPTDIDGVLLVGGTVQIPAVQRWVEQYFEAPKIRCDRPFEAIAHGALQVTQGIEIKDFLYHSYGIRYWNHRVKRHDWHPLINSGQPYPMGQPVELVLGASVEGQPRIELILGELGDQTGGTEVYFDGDRLVTRVVRGQEQVVRLLNDRDGARSLATLEPLGSPGVDRIKVNFWVDESRFLRVTVEDLLTLDTLITNQAVVQLS